MHPTLPSDFALPKAKPRVREWCEPGPSSDANWRVQRVGCWLDSRLQYALRTSCFNFSYFSSSTESTKSKFCKTHKVTDIRSAGQAHVCAFARPAEASSGDTSTCEAGQRGYPGVPHPVLTWICSGNRSSKRTQSSPQLHKVSSCNAV